MDDNNYYVNLRKKMVKTQIFARGIYDPRVIDAFLTVPRHLFVNKNQQDLAYLDHPLPIGSNQTISQPYIVSLMTYHLKVKKTDHVLEIGTGCGYQTAILALLGKEVYTIERIEALQQRAKIVLDYLNYSNIFYRIGNGFHGWTNNGPYDVIIVTASPKKLPESLISQLAEGGRMVIPIGSSFWQKLYLFTKTDNKITKEYICNCRFVEMVNDK